MVLTPQEKADQLMQWHLEGYKKQQEIFNLYQIPEGSDPDKFFAIMAKHSAIHEVKLILYELIQITKPTNTTFILTEAREIKQTGEEKIEYWKEVEAILRKYWPIENN